MYKGEEKIFVYNDKTDYFREILGKGARRENKEQDSLGLGEKAFLGIMSVVGVFFFVGGISLFYETYLGSGLGDGDWFVGGFLSILSTLIGLFFILIPTGFAWSDFAGRRLLALVHICRVICSCCASTGGGICVGTFFFFYPVG